MVGLGDGCWSVCQTHKKGGIVIRSKMIASLIPSPCQGTSKRFNTIPAMGLLTVLVTEL